MPSALDDYKALIDGFARIRESVVARWVREAKFPPTSDYARAAPLCARLSEADREEIARLVVHARDGGIHDALVFLHDEMQRHGLCLTKDGRELPLAPFGTQLYYDWVTRAEGQPWPDESGEVKS